MFEEMKYQIHQLEKEAYFSVLRAFKAQADAITWDKEGLITELRKELRVSDDEHRELLGRVNNDEAICKIREWRQGGGNQAPILSTSHPVHELISSPTFSASRKKQRTAQPHPSVGAVHPHSGSTLVQLSPSVRGLGSRGRKPRKYSSRVGNGRNKYGYHAPPGVPSHGTAGLGSELVGRKVLTRWPDDNNFYEAVITEYHPLDGTHSLMYDENTPNVTWERVDLREIPPEDIRWVGDDPVLSLQGCHEDEQSVWSQSKREHQNGTGQMDTDDIEILHTDTLIQKVEKVAAASHPDRLEIERAKKMLKEHEQALVQAISRLSYLSDGESDGHPQY